MKKYLIALSLVLAACGGGEGEEITVACQEQFWNGTFAICVPEGWDILGTDALRQRGAPSDTVAAFQAQTAAAGQFPTVTVTREILRQPLDSTQYTEASIRSVTVYPQYELVDRLRTLVDGTELAIHVFNAQPVAEEPVRKFYQLSTVSDIQGFTVTAVSPVAVSRQLEAEILLILRSVSFIDPLTVTEEE